MEEQEISVEDVNMALQIIAAFYKKANLAFAVVSSGTGIVISQGNALELEGALNHAHRVMEFDNGTRYMEMRQANEAAKQARNESSN